MRERQHGDGLSISEVVLEVGLGKFQAPSSYGKMIWLCSIDI